MLQVDLIPEEAARQVVGGTNTPISRSAFWRGIKAGRIPKPIKVLSRTNRWSRAELIEAVSRAAAAREKEAA